MFKTDPFVWAKDDAGRRHLCPLSSLADANHVREDEKYGCVADDDVLMTRNRVPSNDPEGRIRFYPTASLS